jgi:hypothetical protein
VPDSLDIPEFLSALRDRFGLTRDSAPTLTMMPVLRADGPEKRVYLDLNHWISLSKVRRGSSDRPAYEECYELLQEMTAARSIAVPLCAGLYMEIHHAINSPQQRADLADVISEVSRFVTIRWRDDLIDSQFDLALNRRFNRPLFPSRPEVFGIGFNFGFEGTQKRMQLEMPDSAPKLLSDLDSLVINQLLGELTEYVMLRGPIDDDLAALASYGYNPAAALEVEQQRLTREVELAEQLRKDPENKKRLDDIVNARELYWELTDRLPERLSHAAMSVDSFFWRGKDWISEFLDDIPTIAVQRQIRRQIFSNGSKPWMVNDLRDLDSLSVAVPYCDAVVGDRAAIDALKRSKPIGKLGTQLLSTPEDLLSWLKNS